MTSLRDSLITPPSDKSVAVHPFVLLLQILGFALAYYVTGELGTYLAIYPGYATAIWPPSGIALAGVLLFGYRIWPGVLLGSILVNISAVVGISPDVTINSVTIAFVIGFAASMQAIIGAYMVRRFGKFPNSLSRSREVLSFMFYGGVLSTLVNPTAAVTTLYAFDRITQGNLLANWLIWWAGDVIGVFIFAPLVLVWMSRPVEMWQNRRVIISLTAVTMLVLIAALMLYAVWDEREYFEVGSVLILLIGLLLTGVVVSLVIVLSGRSNLLEGLVKKRTLELQASYNQLDKISRQLPGVIYQFQQHPDGHYSFPYASVGINDVYELTPEQVKEDAAPVISILHPDDFNEIALSIRRSARNLTHWRQEYRVNLPKKGVRWLLGEANPEMLADGSVLWHGFIMDITEQKEAQVKLRMLSTAIEQGPTSVVIANLNAEIEYVNPRFTMVTGFSQEEVVGKNPRILQSGMTSNKVYEAMWASISNGKNWTGNFINRRKNGEVYYEEAYISPVRDDDGAVRRYVAVKLDISERKKLEESLHSAARYTRSLIESTLDPMVTISTEGKITDVNVATENVTGVSRADLIGTDFAMYFTNPKRAQEGYERVFAKGSITNYMLAIQHKSGFVTDVLYNASVYRDDRGKVLGIIAAARDITDFKRMQEEMRQLAFYDPLTRLANRRLLIDRMDQVMAASKRSGCYGAIIFLDLDNFKPLNDTHGHEVGDLLLIEVANRLKDCIRKTDTAARIGGDEFVVMLTKFSDDGIESRKQAERIAEKIRVAISKPYLLKVRSGMASDLLVEHHCTASIGVAMFLGDGVSQDEIVHQADDTMYQAKESGRNRVLFYEAG